MPCYDSRSNEPRVVYSSEPRVSYIKGEDPSIARELRQQLKEEQDKRKWAEGAICALMCELTRRDIAEDVLAEASRHGLIGLVEFWARHNEEDKARIHADIHSRYSKDEIAIMRQILGIEK